MERINPRVHGIREHLERARLFLYMSRQADDGTTAFRLQLASLYSCRAVADIMLTAASMKQVRSPSAPGAITRDDYEAFIAPRLPYYELIEKIRIHDFHRFGLAPAIESDQIEVSFGGPIKLTGQSGSAAVFVTDTGIQVATSGNGNVRLQRSLLRRDNYFFDDELSQWTSPRANRRYIY